MSISNEIKKTIVLLESIQTSVLLSESELDTLLDEFDLDEANKWKKARAARDEPEAKQARMGRHSTLAPILNRQPGGSSLLRWLHKQMNLGSQADWGHGRAERYSQEKGAKRAMTGQYGSGIWGDSIASARVLWEIIKSHPDNFIVFIGENGVGGLRPKKGYIENKIETERAKGKVYNPSKDGELEYHYAFFNKEGDLQHIDPNVFGGKGVEVEPGKFSTRGGLPFGKDPNPNLLAVVKGVIGRIKGAYAAFPAAPGEIGHSVEREKVAQRVEKQEKQIFKTLSPIIMRVVKALLPRAGEQSRLVQITQTKQPDQLRELIKQEFLNSLKNQAQAQGIEPVDSAGYRNFLAKASRSSPELKNTLKDFQTRLIG